MCELAVMRSHSPHSSYKPFSCILSIQVHHRDDGHKAIEEITDLMEFYNDDMTDRGLIDFKCAYEPNDPSRPISQQIIDFSEREDGKPSSFGSLPSFMFCKEWLRKGHAMFRRMLDSVGAHSIHTPILSRGSERGFYRCGPEAVRRGDPDDQRASGTSLLVQSHHLQVERGIERSRLCARGEIRGRRQIGGHMRWTDTPRAELQLLTCSACSVPAYRPYASGHYQRWCD